jgi:hypothetical protein
MLEFGKESKKGREVITSHSLTVKSNELFSPVGDRKEAILSFIKYSGEVYDYVRNAGGDFWVKKKNQSLLVCYLAIHHIRELPHLLPGKLTRMLMRQEGLLPGKPVAVAASFSSLPIPFCPHGSSKYWGIISSL